MLRVYEKNIHSKNSPYLLNDPRILYDHKSERLFYGQKRIPTPSHAHTSAQKQPNAEFVDTRFRLLDEEI